MSVKLTPEICINNSSSNSRLTAVGRQATAADTILRTVSRLFFFLSPYLWWENNRTIPACWKTYWNCFAFELETLCGVFFWCSFVLLYVSPLIRQLQKTSEAHLQDWRLRQTPKLLRLKLHCIWTRRFFFSIFDFVLLYLYIYIYIYIYISFTYFLFLFLSLLFLFFIFNLLTVSLRPVQLTVD
jgi:hypothetical protein